MHPVQHRIQQLFRWMWFIFIIAGILCIPFHKVFPVFPLGLAGIAGSLSVLVAPQTISIKRQKNLFVAAAIFLIPLYTYLISSNILQAKSDLEVKAALLIIPLVVALMEPVRRFEWIWMQRALIISCIAFILTAIGIAGYKMVTEDYNAFNYKRLVAFTIIHPAYLGMFINFSIMILLFGWLGWSKAVFKLKSHWSLILIAILFVFLVMLTAKNSVLFALLMFFIATIAYVRKSGNWKYAIGLGGGALMVFVLFLTFNSYTRERFSMLYRFNDVEYDNSVNSREETWKAAIEVLQNMPWYGLGSGDMQERLNEQYAVNGFTLGEEESHNAHNQFLQVTLEGGIPGIALLTFLLIYFFRLAFINRFWLYGGFLVLISFNLLTESMLETQSGILFFAVFNAVMLSRIASE